MKAYKEKHQVDKQVEDENYNFDKLVINDEELETILSELEQKPGRGEIYQYDTELNINNSKNKINRALLKNEKSLL